jgi:NTP pyrophosphatase (non-canonical NTP hydrolase)
MTSQEFEALSLLVEECGETCQAIGKIFRHGLDTGWGGETNREGLEKEVADLLGVLQIIRSLNFLNWEKIESRVTNKFVNGEINKYLHTLKIKQEDL